MLGPSPQGTVIEKPSAQGESPLGSGRVQFEYLAIEDAIAGYLDAINQRDSERAASYWSRRGEWTLKNGERISGREKIAFAIKESFDEEPSGTTTSLKEVSIRLITPNVAVEEGVAIVKSSEGEQQTPYAVVHVKMDQGWKIDSVRATQVPVAAQNDFSIEIFELANWRLARRGGRRASCRNKCEMDVGETIPFDDHFKCLTIMVFGNKRLR